MADRITVLVVDDSRLFRAALTEALSAESDIAVVGSVYSGEKALEFIRDHRPDVVTLDVEMPGMDGLKTLQAVRSLAESRPGAPPIGVIMVSAFTRRGARVTIEALDAGAFDFVTKPAASSAEAGIALLRSELTAKIRTWIASRRRLAGGAAPSARPPLAPRPKTGRPTRAGVVVIGASTGGPRALSTLMPDLCARTDLPMLIVQHMPVGFTKALAESLARLTGRKVSEARDGDALHPGEVYIAPGGQHLLLRGSAAAPVAGLNEQAPENGCRPSADVLFRSAAAVYGSAVVAVILTGMGRDGTAGLGAIRRAGGYVIAQDQATSVVWGMPGSAVEAGVVDQVEPLDHIGRAVADVIGRGRPR